MYIGWSLDTSGRSCTVPATSTTAPLLAVCACQPYPNTQSDGSVEDDTSWKSSGPRQWGWTSCEWVEEELLLSCCDLQVVAAARSGHYAVGYELNLWLVLWSRMRALYHGVSKQTEFHRHDLWKVNGEQSLSV